MLTAREVAAMLGIKPRTVYDIPLDQLPRYQLGAGRGAVRYEPADVDTYKAACRSAGTPATSAGASSSTALLRVADTGLAAYFRAAGVKPKLTPTSAKPRSAQTAKPSA